MLLSSSVGAQASASRLEQAKWLAQHHPDSAFRLLRNVLQEAVQQKDREKEGLCLQQMGQIFYHQGRYSQALDHHLQADKIFREEQLPDLLAHNLNEMGTLHYYNKQDEVALKEHREALGIFRKTRDQKGTAFTYGNLGHFYEKRQVHDSAFHYQRLALGLYKQIQDSGGIAKIYENLGSIFEDLIQYDSAQYYFRQSLSINQRQNDQLAQLEVLNNIGDVLRKTGEYRRGLAYSWQAVRLAKKLGELYQLSSGYRDLAKAYHSLQQNDSAFIYMEENRDALLKIYSEENNKQAALLSTLYEIEKKNNAIAQLQNARQRNVLLSIGAGIILVLLFSLGAVALSRQKLKLRNEQALREQNEQMYQTQKELMGTELKNKLLQEQFLKTELETKGKELSSHTLHVIQKSQLLEQLRNRLQELVKEDKRDQKKQLKQLLSLIQQNFSQDKYWEDFRGIFEQVHESFFQNLKQRCPDLTAADLRLVALLKMNLTSTEISTLLNISLDSLRVSRYRLRKKLNLPQGENLVAFIQGLQEIPARYVKEELVL
ncbi:tetratricopeptide repeat protein [Rufibacter sediminis]|uniref:Tetratricopeptide repeat protein n=1 Tax=Rufibacter sediminis TaxID=2762756 RepID=A0ABR6VYJ6_9BACT|nr:tetratricopeptide repeat protein [Rufibacter sediminis]MBC3542225.1 tetratricopeptide repeat protein [Rufibacter sediminis]